MRIHSVTFTGVGPYRERQHIDFQQLKGNGLYLISGVTGAGKSTIIDAIVFALYGRVSADDSDESRLRSDFAGPTDRTEVELVFETSSGVFRVLRSPRYLRAKKGGGEALTVENATCKVLRVHADGSETEVAKNIASAKSELQSILGLSADQFLQTVVLPQGQFATFLRAKTSERAAILKKIFGTGLYERIAEVLKEDAKAARAARDDATRALRDALITLDAQSMLGAETRQRLLGLIDDSLDESLLSELAALESEIAEQVSHCEWHAQTARDAWVDADAARTLAKAEASATLLAETAAAALHAANAAVETARIAVNGATALADSLGITVDASLDEPVWRERATQAATAAGALEAALEAERLVAEWPEHHSSLVSRVEDLKQQAAVDATRISELPELMTLQQRIADERPTASEVESRVQRRQDLEHIVLLYERIDVEQAKRARLESTLRDATSEAAEASTAYAVANRQFIDSLAAALAAELEPGQPCPVCGSLEHPHVAVREALSITRDEVEAFELASRAARDRAVKAEEALQHSRQLLHELESQVSISREALAVAQADDAREKQALDARATAATYAEAALSELRVEQERLGAASANLKTDMALGEASLQAGSSDHAKNIRRVESGRATFDSVAARKHAIVDFGVHLATLADALRDLATASTAANEAQASLAALEQRSGFADIATAETDFQFASDRKSAAEEQARDATKRLAAFRDGSVNIHRGCGKRAELVAGNANLLHLAELFNPGRGADSGLHIYVLQSLFANVVEAANVRFETLLGGRFQLVATRDEDGDARSLLGLGLAVHDALTGKTRPATSMSGGETFCASLALALGLADVVRMGAGGIEIGSLFIDEGFGSLDPKPLEDVMTMLRQLGSNGRLVGLISHVPEMKTAIAEKISVLQAHEGQPTHLEISWM